MTAAPPNPLRRFVAPRVPPTPAVERCELCGEQLTSEHPHLADTERRSIACACKACALLFTRPGGRYRTIPDRVMADPARPLTEAEWASLRIPVGMAFFFVNSAAGRVVASYPSPAGVTECELDLPAWDRLAQDHPLLRALEPDVEAIIVAVGTAGILSPETVAGDAGQGVEAFLVPIDACYSLCGALRLTWRGFDGGAEARGVLTDFLAGLRRRARPL